MSDISQLQDHSRIWIYQSNREFTETEADQINNLLTHFVAGWAAHQKSLYAAAELRYKRFIILAVDEAQVGASGCSIDSSVHFLNKLEEEFQISLFDRMLFAYKEAEAVNVLDRGAFEDAIERAEITSDTLVFNNLVKTKQEFDAGWEVPLAKSWHARFFASSLQKA